MEETEYKLIQSVDPTKIKVPLKERFAKLTLSSHKKKRAQEEQQLKSPEENGEKQIVEKRQSASRNLMDQLNEQQNNIPLRNISSTLKKHVNPILRSNSSSMCASCDEAQLNSSGEYEDALEESNFMEPLQVSATNQEKSDVIDNDMEQHLHTLSQRISSMTVNECTDPVTGPMVISATKECCNISSTDESEFESGGAITISDSSINSTAEDILDYELITSNIPQSGETNDFFLPNTLSNDKADRIEAFLKDVSQDYRNRVQFQCTAVRDTEEMDMESIRLSEIVVDDSNPDMVQKKAKDLATADTESMTSLSEIFVKKMSIDHITTNQNIMLNDTIDMSQTNSLLFEMKSHGSVEKNSDFRLKPEDSAEGLQLDDTVANTFNSPLTSKEHTPTSARNYNSFVHNTYHGNEDPNDSLVISETSSEAEKSNTQSYKNEIVVSEEIVNSSNNNDEDSSSSEVKLSMGRINISAKINIKIQISTQTLSNDEEMSLCGDETHDIDKKRTPSLPETASNTEFVTQYEEQRQQTTDIEQAIVPKTPTLNSPNNELIIETDTENVDEHFITHAEKLLTQLYGKSWQTPDVIRTLKRVSGSDGKPSTAKTRLVNKETSNLKKPPSRKCGGNSNENSHGKAVEESALDDFSIFQRNIIRTNLNSTSLVTPEKDRTHLQQKGHYKQQNVCSEPRVAKKELPITKDSGVFKVPQTEVKKRIITTRRGRVVQQKWKQLVDSDSDDEGDNASDDEDADKTGNVFSSDDDRKSVHSWSNGSLNSSDSDVEDDKRKKKIITRRKNFPTTHSKRTNGHDGSNEGIVYLDLSKEEVTFLEGLPTTPPANNDENFNLHLQDILRTCKYEDKPKLESATDTPQRKTKRKLFNANFGDEPEESPATLTVTPKTHKASDIEDANDIVQDLENLHFNDQIMSGKVDIINKHLESIKTGKPIFKVTPIRATNDTTPTTKRNATDRKKALGGTESRLLDQLSNTPIHKYGFLQSLDVSISKSFCHPKALCYRENYRLKKEELSTILYDLYNEKLFNNDLKVPLKWNKKLSNTAGRCVNRKKFGTRFSEIELSEKVLTSADRLRCTLIHELCHAATWVFNGEGGHGNTWKEWARKANIVFPELPIIKVCHQYEIEYKYTYKCTLCAAKSHAHSKSKKVENIRCSYCHGAIEIFLNKKDKEGNILPTPLKEPTGFAKFVKDNYKKHKRPEMRHADVMKILSNEFAALKVANN